MRQIFWALSLCLLATSPVMAQATSSLPLKTDEAIMGWLDKITGRVSEFSIRTGEPVTHGTLTIALRTCRTRPPEDPPESAVFLEVTERAPGETDARTPETPLFTGWMFASSPAVSALEHGVYDVWVLSCAGTSEVAQDDITPLPSFLDRLPEPD